MNIKELTNSYIQNVLKFEAPLPSNFSSAAAPIFQHQKCIGKNVSQIFGGRAATLAKPIPEPVGKVIHHVIPGSAADGSAGGNLATVCCIGLNRKKVAYLLPIRPCKKCKRWLQAVTKGDDNIVSGLKNKTMVGINNVMPDTIVAEQMKKMQGPIDESKK